MENLIQPNLHPLVVHFAIAFLITGPIFLLIASFSSDDRSWREGIRMTGDWLLVLGMASLLVALGAGFHAYFTVAHDGPSHLAMTDHRNWALGTALLFFLLATWRFLKRGQFPGKLFSILLLIPVLTLAVTGWKGGHLVFQYGIGVASLPIVSGDGHDHDHGDAHDHEVEESNEMHLEDPRDDQIPVPIAPTVDAPKSKASEVDEHDHSGHEH